MQVVNIYSAIGCEGGSTAFFRDLTNKLNENGYDATFFSPQKQTCCKSEVMSDRINLNQEDNIVISHMLPVMSRVHAKKLILSTHEMEMGEIKEYYHDFDLIHYVSDHQKEWHNIDHPSVVIPPFVDKLEPNYVEGRNTAGIIGHLHKHKQIHLAVEMALKDKCDQVLIFGGMGSYTYFNKHIWPLLDGEKVRYCGPQYNKQKMMDSFDVLYSASKSETYSLVISESMFAGKKIVVPDGCEYLDCRREFNDDKLIDEWVQILEG